MMISANICAQTFTGQDILSMLMVVVMLIAFGIALTMRLIREGRYEDAKNYNDSPSVMMEVASYDQAIQDRDAMLAKYNSINTVVDTLDSYPVCTDDVIDIIEETARRQSLL